MSFPYAPPADPTMMDPSMMGAPPMMPPMGAMPPMGGMAPQIDPATGMQLPPGPLMVPPPGPMEMMAPVPPPVPEFHPPGPSLPPWYTEPKKPKLEDILEDAERERSAHTPRIEQTMLMIRRLNGERFGISKKDRQLYKIGEVEKGQLQSLRDEHDGYCAHVAKMDWTVKVPLKDSIDKEETTAKEDAGHYILECFERQHSAAGNASLKWAMPDMVGKYGMIVASAVLDPLNEECGLRMQMIDPATVFPVFEGGMGLARVYRVYQATASQVLGSFFDGSGKLEKTVRKAATSNGGRYDPHHTGEVIEYWDRAHVMVAYEGKEIFYRKHGYGKVPFRIKYAGFGQQGFTQTANLGTENGVVVRNFGSSNSDLRCEDLLRIAQPFLQKSVASHDQREADFGLMRTALRRGVNPEWLYQLGLQSHNDGTPDHKPREGGIRVLRDDDKAQPIFPQIDPNVIGSVTAGHTMNTQTGMASGVIMGMMPGAQTTGDAGDILGQPGTDKWTPIVTIIEEFLTEFLEWCFELWRDWGAILGMGDELGVISVPRRSPNPRTGEAPAHDLTPEILRRVGIRCGVELSRFNPTNLSQLANGLAILFNMGVIDKRSIIEFAGITNNPDMILDRIDDETLDSVPEVKQEKTLRRLYKLAEIAEKRGDMDSARENMNRAYFIASQMQHKMMYGMPADPNGLAPGMPVPPNVAITPDSAMAGMPGSQGGRPPGGGAPQGVTPQGPLGG